MYSSLDNAMQLKLDKINEIKNYFMAEIRKRETILKLSKYVASFDC